MKCPNCGGGRKWAYHGTSLRGKSLNFEILNSSLPPEEIGFTHLNDIAENGLSPNQSTRQSLSYRKSILEDRIKEKFVYFYERPSSGFSIPDVYMLVSYGEGLVAKYGGAILRFPFPTQHWPDPDEESPNILMTNQTIPAHSLQVLVPPAKFYEKLGGKGTRSWGPLDHAVRYLASYCIEKERYWYPLLQDDFITNPWVNQKDRYLD